MATDYDKLIRCCACGDYIPEADMRTNAARFEFTPDTPFGPEKCEWFCRACAEKHHDR